IVGAGVIARDVSSQVARQTATNAEGAFAFTDLPEGSYEIRVEREGFQPFARAGLAVAANAVLQLDVQLAIDAHADSVVVVESASTVAPSGAEIAAALEAKQIGAIPMNARSYTDLLALQP